MRVWIEALKVYNLGGNMWKVPRGPKKMEGVSTEKYLTVRRIMAHIKDAKNK
jgi:hypothetical protein